MGNRRKIRRLRIIISLVLAIPTLIFSQAEYQITSIPNSAISLASHNGLDALKKNSHFFLSSDNINIDYNSLSLLHFPAQINLLNYSNYYLNISFLDYGTFQNQIDNQILNQFTSYEVMAKIYFHKKIKNLLSIKYAIGGLYSKIDDYTSFIILSDFTIDSKINNYNVSFSLNNIGIILDSYTNHSTEIPLTSQFSIIKKNKNSNLYFGYDVLYHFSIDNIEHVVCLYANISDYIDIMVSGSNYRKKLRVDDFNNDALYGIGFGINIRTTNNKKIDIGISSLGPAGYIYGLTFNF